LRLSEINGTVCLPLFGELRPTAFFNDLAFARREPKKRLNLEGRQFTRELLQPPIDVLTGTEKWSFPYFSNPNGGALSSSGGVVLAGDSDGNFIALDATRGRDLWHAQLGAAIYSTAITFELDGKQYVVIPAGSALFAFALQSP
jgi:hypothetical protein